MRNAGDKRCGSNPGCALRRRALRRFAAGVHLFGVTLAMPFQATVSSPVGTDCAAAEFRRLDFRLGAFDVTTASGIHAGSNRVEQILHGCAIIEHWTGAISGEGRGMTNLDRNDHLWHMSYVNDSGNALYLVGAFEGDALVLRGFNVGFDGRHGLHRMTWSPLAGSGVRQLWEISTDRGAHWETIFDGRYTPQH